MSKKSPIVAIIMGSDSDLDVMSKAAKILDDLQIPYSTQVLSAHRTPEKMAIFAQTAESNGYEVIIAGAGGSAHLPGMTAAYTILPVIAVPIKRDHHGDEAMKSSRYMPPGVPLAVMPNNGAQNAALFAAAILARKNEAVNKTYSAYRKQQHDEVIAKNDALHDIGWKTYLGES